MSHLINMLIKISECEKAFGHVDEYVSDRGLDAIVGCTGINVYEDYCEFCKERGYAPSSNIGVRRTLCNRYGLISVLKRVGDKVYRVLTYP